MRFEVHCREGRLVREAGRETEKGSDPPSAILECLQQLGLRQAEVQGLEHSVSDRDPGTWVPAASQEAGLGLRWGCGHLGHWPRRLPLTADLRSRDK